MSRQADIWDKGTAIGALVIVTGFYAYVFFSIPVYQELFRDFETSLPISTRIVFGTYLYWNIFVVLGVVGCILILWRSDRRGWYFLVPALLSVFLLLSVTVWAMYAPILEQAGAT